MRALIFAIAALTAAPAASTQQNLIQNGDFENGLAPWQVFGPGFLPGLYPMDCDGDGTSSTAFGVAPGSRPASYHLAQPVRWQADAEYRLRSAIRGTGSLVTSGWTLVLVWTGSLSDGKLQRQTYQGLAVRAHSARSGLMIELAGKVVPKSGENALILELFQERASNDKAFRMHIDNVELYASGQIPWTRCTTARECTTTTRCRPNAVTFRTTFVKPNVGYVLMLGTKRFRSGIPLPGVRGLLELDPSGGAWSVGSGLIGTSGFADMTLPLPAAIYDAIQCKPLYWMPVVLETLPVRAMSLGKVGLWGFK